VTSAAVARSEAFHHSWPATVPVVCFGISWGAEDVENHDTPVLFAVFVSAWPWLEAAVALHQVELFSWFDFAASFDFQLHQLKKFGWEFPVSLVGVDCIEVDCSVLAVAGLSKGSEDTLSETWCPGAASPCFPSAVSGISSMAELGFAFSGLFVSINDQLAEDTTAIACFSNPAQDRQTDKAQLRPLLHFY
jgi:hypothetical protein